MDKKLGKLPRIFDNKIPTLHRVMRLACPSHIIKPPEKTNWRAQVKDWPMLANDSIGDCMVAAMEHAVQGWTANNGTEEIPDTDATISVYEQLTQAANGVAFDPTTGAGDTGLVPDMAINYWMNTGINVKNGGPLLKLDGQAEVDPTDFNAVKNSINEFGGVFVGFQLPTSASDEFDDEKPWSDTGGDVGGWGGHATWGIDYDDTYFYIVTWGKIQKVEHKFWVKYADQCKALLQRSWINSKTNTSPSSLNLACLNEQIQEMRGVLTPYQIA